MRALHRTVSALLAIVSGLVFAMLITTLLGDREIKVVGFALFALGGVLAGVVSVVLWSRTIERR